MRGFLERGEPHEDHSNAQGSVSPLRQRMLEDMTIRGFGEQTKRDYVRQVRMFAAFIDRKPVLAEPEDLRRYQLHMAASGASASTMNQACAALRFFFHVTLGRPGFGDRMARIRTPERLPVVLSPEVALLLAHASNLKHRAALSVAYGCGLAHFRDRQPQSLGYRQRRMLIRVEQARGRKDRYVSVVARSARAVTAVVAGERPKGWLFQANSQASRSPHASSAAPALPPKASASSARRVVPCTRCGTVSPRIFWSRRSISASSRRCSATGSLDTTAIYTRVALKTIPTSRARSRCLAPPASEDRAVMARPRLEVADIFRRHGEAYLAAHAAGRLSLGQLWVVVSRQSGLVAPRRSEMTMSRAATAAAMSRSDTTLSNRHFVRSARFCRAPWLDKRRLIYRRSPTITSSSPAGGDRRNRFPKQGGALRPAQRTAAETLTTYRRRDPPWLGVESDSPACVAHLGIGAHHHHVHIIVPGAGLSPDGER